MPSPARRYVVKMVTMGSPGWSGTLWAVGCKHRSSAETLFERRVAKNGERALRFEEEARASLPFEQALETAALFEQALADSASGGFEHLHFIETQSTESIWTQRVISACDCSKTSNCLTGTGQNLEIDQIKAKPRDADQPTPKCLAPKWPEAAAAPRH